MHIFEQSTVKLIKFADYRVDVSRFCIRGGYVNAQSFENAFQLFLCLQHDHKNCVAGTTCRCVGIACSYITLVLSALVRLSVVVQTVLRMFCLWNLSGTGSISSAVVSFVFASLITFMTCLVVRALPNILRTSSTCSCWSALPILDLTCLCSSGVKTLKHPQHMNPSARTALRPHGLPSRGTVHFTPDAAPHNGAIPANGERDFD